MRPTCDQSAPATTILMLMEIKAAVEAFDRGESNVFDAWDAIIVAVEAHQAALGRHRLGYRPHDGAVA